MKIGKKFNKMSKGEYYHCIDNHKKYNEFNTLGLYRSITENDKLTLQDKIDVRDHANKFFGKSFNFLQIKDPVTFFELVTLGKELTISDERQIWDDIRKNQEKILKDKKIKHRNFGVYSKHICYDTCPMNGIMVKQGTWMAEGQMFFPGDRSRYGAQEKSDRNKKARKNKRRIIGNEFDY